jgi:hypothetical protein
VASGVSARYARAETPDATQTPDTRVLVYDPTMCVNCLSNAEAVVTAALFATYVLKPPVHRLSAKLDLAPVPDPIAHDVRTVAFLNALDLDPQEILGAEVVAQASAWTPDNSWVPLRDRLRSASRRPIGSHSRMITT